MRRFILSICLLLFGALTLQAHPGIGIVQDTQGNIFYTDLVHVWKICPDGERSIAVRDVHTHELYLDADGNLYGEHEWYEGEATDKWGNYVWCLTTDGKFQKVIPDVEGFLNNTTLVRDPDGNSYWSNKVEEGYILMKESPDGVSDYHSRHIFQDIRWKYFSKDDGNLYIVDHLSIKRVDSLGKVEVIAEDLKEGRSLFSRVQDRHYVFGLWTDPSKDLYVALYGAKKVKKISPDGQISTVFESEGRWSPCGGLTAKDGTMWIMEFSNRNKVRVHSIGSNGVQKTFEGE